MRTTSGGYGPVFVAGKLVQRTWQDESGNKRQTVEIQVTHVGPNLQVATAEVAKSTADRLKSASGGPSGCVLGRREAERVARV